MASPRSGGKTGLPISIFATWWKGDPLPRLLPLTRFSARVADDAARLARLLGRTREDVETRLARSDRVYLARVGAEIVGYGWSAAKEAEIGELGLRFRLPPGNHYLYDFRTFPTRRGRGVYPHLLQAILGNERSEANHFWIGYNWNNVASAHGIRHAGFQLVGEVDRLPSGLVLRSLGPLDRAAVFAALLGLEAKAKMVS